MKKSLLLMLFLALTWCWTAKAEVVTIGTGTSTQTNSPIANYYNYSLTEMIYTAAEIGNPSVNTILSVGFQLASAGLNGKTYDITVYMKNIDADEFASAAFEALDASDQVFLGQISATAAGWVTIDLDVPFAYDATKNLLIGINKTAGGYAGSSYYWNYSTASKSQNLYKQNDSSPYSISNLPTYPTLNTSRPNVQLTFGTPPSCAKPIGLEATLTQGNGTIATLNWTAGSETNWVLEYGTASNFNGATSVNVSGTPSKDLTGLTAETTYYARVKADCGGDGESEWSNTCEFTPTKKLTLTVNDGTTTNNSVPIYGYDVDGSVSSQFVLPASAISALQAKSIESMKFYASQSTVGWNGAQFEVYMLEVDEASLSSEASWSDMTKVMNAAHLEISGGEMIVTLSSSYDYQGGNLLIGFKQTASGTWGSASWYGVSATGASIGGDNGSGSQMNFLPKITFSFSSNDFPKPKSLAVNGLTSNGATISWAVPNANVTGYQYQYKAEGGDWSALATTSNVSVALSGLSANTNYDFRVKAIYGSDESEFASINFATPCGVYAIPYAYGFENESDINCWTIVNTATAGNCEIYEDAEYARTGDKSFMFFYTEAPSQYLISPELGGIVNGLHVEFYYRQYENGEETFKVGYSTTNNDVASFIWGDEITNSSMSYQRFSANYPAGTKYVAIQHTSDDQYYFFVDDVLFEEAASCLEPTSVVANTITTSEASISWTNGGEEASWDLYYATNATVPADDAVPSVAGITSKPYSLTGLTQATTYYVYVRSACSSSEHSTWSSPVIFNTECEAMALPYSYGFEEASLPVCWSIFNSNTSYCGININTTAANAHDGNNCLAFYRGSNTGTLIAILPEVDAANYPLNQYEVTFWAKGANPLSIGIMTDPEDSESFVELGSVTPSGSYAQYTVRFNAYTGAGRYIALKNNHSVNGTTYLDDIEVNHLPSCLEISDLAVDNSSITGHSAKLEWTGTSAAYNIDYRTAAYMNGIEEHFNTNSIPSVWSRYTGLVDEVIAGSADPSSYSGGWTTTTYGLGTYNAKLNIYGSSCKYWLVTPEVNLASGSALNFDLALTAYNSNNAASGACEDDRFVVLVFADGAWTILREWNNSGSQYVYNSIATTGENVNIDISAYVGKDIKIAFYGESTVSGDDNDLHIDNVTIGVPVAAGEWQRATSNEEFKTLTELDPETKYEAKVQGNCGSDSTSEWSDLVSFTTDIACPAPSNLLVSEVTPQSATLSWKENGEAAAWDVAYKLASAEDFTIISQVVDTPYVLNGLNSAQDYTVKVRANCGGSDGVSEWTAVANFTTLADCPVPVLDSIVNIKGTSAKVYWSGNALNEGYEVSYRTAAYIDGLSEEFGTSIPSGWENKSGLLSSVQGGTALSTTAQWYFGTSNGVFGNHARINIYGNSRYGWLIMPSLAIVAGYELNFDLALTAYSGTGAASGTCDDDRFIVLISTDDEATWTILREWNNSGSAFVYNEIATAGQHVNIDLADYSGQNARIAFYGESTVSGNGDNNLHINNVCVGTAIPEGSWVPANASSPYSLTGLAPETKYDVKVKGLCAGDAESDDSNILSFSTIVACPAPSGLSVQGVTATTATLAWTEVGDATAWQICLNGDEEHLIAANTNPFTLIDLTAETAYTAKVRANCDISDQSAWSSEINIKTAYGLPFAPKFTSSTIPSDWSKSTSPADDVFAGSPMASASSSWYLTQSDTVIDAYHFRGNIYGTTWKNWIVTPAIDLSGASSSDMLILNFEAGLTAYNSSKVSTMYTGEDDRFIVAVSADGGNTWLQANATEWNNVDGNAQVYNDIPTHGKLYQINMSAFAGQVVKIGFYGESTEDNADNYFHFGKINLHKAEAYSLEIDASLYATYYNADDAFTMPENLTGHVFSTENTPKMLVQEYEAGDIVPAATPLVIEATAAGIYSLEPTMGGISPVAASQLVGVNEVTSAIETSSAHQFFVLSLNSNNDAGSIGFYYYDADHVNGGFPMVKAHKAYLKVPVSELPSGAPSAFFLFNGENGATWLENLEGVEGTVKFLHEGKIFILREGVIYDATGRQVRKL